MPELEIFLLGSPRIERDGAPARVDTRKAIALAVADGSHRRDTLALLLWPEAEETHARAALRRTLSSLNRALEGHGLSIDRETVGLSQRHPLSVDAIRFRSLIDLRLGHDHPVSEVCEACIEPSEEAVAIYKGDFLSGFSLRDSPEFDDWQLSQAERMRRDLASVLETLVRGHGATGNFERAIDHARSWVALDPLAERSHRELMKVYGWLEQRAAAQRQYRDCVRIMDRELGVSPLEETTELYRAIMEDRGPPKPAFAAESKGSDPGAPEAPARTAAPAPERSSSYPLVGRKKEWEILLRDYQAVGNEGRLVVLQGESGIGKTRLAEDFLEHVRARGGVTLAAKCYEGESTLAYSPFVSAFSSLLASESGGLISKVDSNWLSEASRLLPQLRDLKSEVAPPTPLDTPGARIRFFEAVGQIMQDTLAGAVPGVLFIDDLQWADDASIELLSYLVRRLRSRSILVLLAIRPDVVASRSLQILLADAQRSDVATIVEIGRLDLPSTVELARAVTGDARGPPEGFEEWLYRETEGLPFFLVEYLPAALSGSEDEGFDWEMPMRVRSLLLSRVSALSETGRQLLDTAAVIGRRPSVIFARPWSLVIPPPPRCKRRSETYIHCSASTARRWAPTRPRRPSPRPLTSAGSSGRSAPCTTAEATGPWPRATLHRQTASWSAMTGLESGRGCTRTGASRRSAGAGRDVAESWLRSLPSWPRPAATRGLWRRPTTSWGFWPGTSATSRVPTGICPLVWSSPTWRTTEPFGSPRSTIWLSLIEPTGSRNAPSSSRSPRSSCARSRETATGRRRSTTIWPTCTTTRAEPTRRCRSLRKRWRSSPR